MRARPRAVALRGNIPRVDAAEGGERECGSMWEGQREERAEGDWEGQPWEGGYIPRDVIDRSRLRIRVVSGVERRRIGEKLKEQKKKQEQMKK